MKNSEENISVQFLSKALLEDIDETSVSSGVGSYQARSGMGADTYKKHPGDRTTGGMIYRDLWEEGMEEDLEEVFSSQEKDKVYDLLAKLKQIDYDAYKKLLMAIIDPKPYKYADAESELGGKLALSENYSRFKNETKTRPKADQFHQAVREVKKRVHEIHKVLEYVNRLKEELSEGESDLKYKKHTEEAMTKIKEMVSELNTKIKKLK